MGMFQAAHAVLELQEHGKPVYKVKNVSLNALCEHYGSSFNPLKDQIKAVYRRDQRFWAKRPLTMDMICYAAADVLSLVPEIYNAMKRCATATTNGCNFPEYNHIAATKASMPFKASEVKQKKMCDFFFAQKCKKQLKIFYGPKKIALFPLLLTLWWVCILMYYIFQSHTCPEWYSFFFVSMPEAMHHNLPSYYDSICVCSAMKPEFINLFGELCEEQVMLYIDPEGVKTKKKQRKVDFEISDLRLKLANTSSKNIVLSNREIRLLR